MEKEKGDNMKKYIVIGFAIIFCVILIVFTGCTYYENVTFKERDSQLFISYQENEYYKTSLFTTTEYYGIANESDVELGYYYSFPFSTKFYSDTLENPTYIYTVGGDTDFYLREGYDYMSDTYTVEKSSQTVVLSEVLTQSDLSEESLQPVGNSIELDMYLKNHPNVRLPLQLFSDNNNWYAITSNKEIYLVSQSFLSLLDDADIIQTQN
jgi:hypothetical protein